MSDTQTIELSTPGQKRVGLVVRGKMGADHHPGKMEQHADCLLANGAPIGFYGEGGGMSASVGMGLDGVVYDYAELRVKRPYYVDSPKAVAYRVVSTALLVKVTDAQAAAFAKAWDTMDKDPGNFNILGGNCSSHASQAFVAAGILKSVIPGLDTPDRLYDQLVGAIPDGDRTSITGFLGALPMPDGSYYLEVVPYAQTPAVNAPNAGSSSYGA